MAKIRKTRKEKIRSSIRQDERVKTPSVENLPEHTHSTISYSLPIRKHTAASSITISQQYSHIAHDLRKTLFVTAAIIVAQGILVVLLANR